LARRALDDGRPHGDLTVAGDDGAAVLADRQYGGAVPAGTDVGGGGLHHFFQMETEMRPGKRKPCKNKRRRGHVSAPKQGYDAIYIPSFLVNEGSILLHHIIYSSKATGVTGMTTLSLAQILGESEVNNRRDHITSC